LFAEKTILYDRQKRALSTKKAQQSAAKRKRTALKKKESLGRTGSSVFGDSKTLAPPTDLSGFSFGIPPADIDAPSEPMDTSGDAPELASESGPPLPTTPFATGSWKKLRKKNLRTFIFKKYVSDMIFFCLPDVRFYIKKFMKRYSTD